MAHRIQEQCMPFMDNYEQFVHTQQVKTRQTSPKSLITPAGNFHKLAGLLLKKKFKISQLSNTNSPHLSQTTTKKAAMGSLAGTFSVFILFLQSTSHNVSVSPFQFRSKIFPGLRILLGSRARLSVRISSNWWGSTTSWK